MFSVKFLFFADKNYEIDGRSADNLFNYVLYAAGSNI